MVTLLFAVFVVLYALNLKPETSSEAVAGSMQDSFNTPMADIPAERRIGPTEAGYGIFEHFRGDQTRPPITKKYPVSKQQIKVIDDEFQQIKMQIEERLYGPNKSLGSEAPGEARVVEIQRTASGFKLKLLARHFYDPGSVDVKREALHELDEVSKIVKELGRPVTIEGHTDSIPPPGNMTNWELSALRATHVLRYMIRTHNFPASKISAAGYADQRPIAHNGTASGRSLNRRIEIQVNYEPQSNVEPE